MAKKPNLTTKPQYKTGYEAGQANQPRKSPHREGTAITDIWFAGYDAYMDGGKSPEEPRKKRTKAEMKEALTAPPSKTTSTAWRTPVSTYNPTPREDGILENMFTAKKALEAETDVELREILHMELADLEWLVYIEKGEKPSNRWEEYKTERGLNFDRKVA